LILSGKDTTVEKIDLNAALTAADGNVNSDTASGRVDFVAVEASDPEYLQIRGYKPKHV
jgi:hypothetical protein